MTRKGEKRQIIGLDVGTSKVVAVVGEYTPGADNTLERITGIGTHDSRGLRSGGVIDVGDTVIAIQNAVLEAEQMAGCQISSAYVSISGAHVQCKDIRGNLVIRHQEVIPEDLDAVLNNARTVAVPADQRILHALPREYSLDGQEGIRNPVGMSGVRLEVLAHLVLCASSAASNVEKCVQRCGMQVDELVLGGLASSLSVLMDDERDLGVVLVDIGAGTTDVSVFSGGGLCYTASLPVAGNHVTSDIAHLLRTPISEAEQIKVRYACALTQFATAEETIQVAGLANRAPRRIPRQEVAQAVQGRYEEIFEMVQAKINQSGFSQKVRAGVVLTGGAAKMEGVLELAEEILGVPVRIGAPKAYDGLGEIIRDPAYATAVGLLLKGMEGGSLRRPVKSVSPIWPQLAKFTNWFRRQF